MRHDPTKHKARMRMRRRMRIRGQVHGTAQRPRLSVFRSSKHTFLQLIDDATHKTLIAVRTSLKTGEKTKVERAKEAARELAVKAKLNGITRVVFDRGGYAYHGRVKMAAEGAREGGLEF